MKIRLTAIGHWPDTLFGKESDFIDPAYLIRKPNYTPKEKLQIIKYLKSAPAFCSWLGYSYDRMRPEINGPYMGDSDLTDGTWSWPEGLKHYVQHYNIMLPKEFLDHLRENQFSMDSGKVKEFIQQDALDMNAEDFTFWTEWCLRIAKMETVKKPLPDLKVSYRFPKIANAFINTLPEMKEMLNVIDPDLELWFYFKNYFYHLCNNRLNGFEIINYKYNPWLIQDNFMQMIWREITNPDHEELLIKRIQSTDPAGAWPHEVYKAALIQLHNNKGTVISA